MAENTKNGDSQQGDADSSSGGLWGAIKSLFDDGDGPSLREQLEEAIDEHEDEQAGEGAEPAAKGDLSPTERMMIRNLLHFSEHDADDVAVPRGQIIALDADCSWDEVVALFAEHGHSRMPVFRETLDDVIGMMHIKDVFTVLATGAAPPSDWTTMLRQPLYVPQARGALDVLADMRAQKVHLAIVLDEFGGTAGMVTINDLLEQLAGEVHDELRPGLPDFARDGDGAWSVRGLVSIVEVNQRLGLDLPCEDYNTLAGLVFGVLGRTPEPGDEVQLSPDDSVRCRVLATNGRRATLLRLASPRA